MKEQAVAVQFSFPQYKESYTPLVPYFKILGAEKCLTDQTNLQTHR